MKKVLKGILHIVACYALLTVAQPFIYRFAGFIGAWASTGWFVSITYGIGMAICYGMFVGACVLITEKLGTKPSTIISVLLCAAQIIYGQVMTVRHEWYFDSSSAFAVTSWIATVLAVIMLTMVLFAVPEKHEDYEDTDTEEEIEFSPTDVIRSEKLYRASRSLYGEKGNKYKNIK